MNWIDLNKSEELNTIDTLSSQKKAVVIFKHSTRCSISSMAKSRFESEWIETEDTALYLLDLLKYRDISNLIAERYKIEHQSPQVIVIKNGKALFSSTHNAIRAQEIQQNTN